MNFLGSWRLIVDPWRWRVNTLGLPEKLLPGLRRAGGGYTFGSDKAEGLLLFHVKEHNRMVRFGGAEKKY